MQVCINIPSIVYQNVFAGETSNLSSVAFYTPSGSGIFRVSATIYVTGTNVGVTGTIINASGNDDGTLNFQGSDSAFGQRSQAGEAIFTGFASTPFSISTTISPGPATYDVWVTVEQVQ